MTPQDRKLNELSKVLDGLQKELIAIRDSLPREPREWWLEIENGTIVNISPNLQYAHLHDNELVKVREVM